MKDDGYKKVLYHASMLANLVALGLQLTVSMPGQIWLSTTIRDVGHCVEGLYAHMPATTSVTSRDLT